jgi:hypothetical protein
MVRVSPLEGEHSVAAPRRRLGLLAGLAPILEDPGQTPVFSVASLWELVIKQAHGHPDFNVQPALLRSCFCIGIPSTVCSSPRPTPRVCC